MPEKFEGLGCSLLYPETWELEEELDAQSFTLQSPEGAFMSVSRCEDTESALKHAREVMLEEYDEVEQEALKREIADVQLSGITQRFVYLDLVVTSQLLCLQQSDKKYLIQIQGEDRVLEKQQLVFDAMLTSMCQSLTPT